MLLGLGIPRQRRAVTKLSIELISAPRRTPPLAWLPAPPLPIRPYRCRHLSGEDQRRLLSLTPTAAAASLGRNEVSNCLEARFGLYYCNQLRAALRDYPDGVPAPAYSPQGGPEKLTGSSLYANAELNSRTEDWPRAVTLQNRRLRVADCVLKERVICSGGGPGSTLLLL
jgi:hypothetical protein